MSARRTACALAAAAALAAGPAGMGASGASDAAVVSSPSVPGAPHGPARVRSSSRGVVVAGSEEAARAGAEVLAAGGNAVDAAVATAFALAATLPQAGNLAGGGFLVARLPAGDLFALDFRETAPAGAWERTFLAGEGRLPAGASLTSGLAVATPGTVRGLAEAHRRLGRLPWRSLLAPAERLAREGFRVPRELTSDLVEERAVFASHPESRRVFFPGGRPLPAGSLFRQPELAATLAAIAERGADAFHEGPIADAVVAWVRSEGGVLAASDLAGYRPVWRPPHVVPFERWELVTMPLPSSGGFLLSSILGQLGDGPVGWRGTWGSLGLHLLLEAERRAFADRNRWLADPACAEVPVRRLLSPSRLAELAGSIDPTRATPSAGVRAGLRESEQTTHLSVATSDGAAVALTTTLNGTFGNGSWVPGVGVLLNNEMDDFATAPGRPNLFGLVQGAANAVRGGARPLSSMTPTIVLEDGRLRMVLGSPGGSTIPTTVLQVFLRAGPLGQPLAEAVAAPRAHHQHLPDAVFVERGAFRAETLAGLAARGHDLRPRDPIGIVHGVEVRPDGTLVGVADPRSGGEAAVPSPPPPR
ncbi:MAG: gamma-glutamyltransferase [Acidobacteria bacterium]|nr:MAG: gamma-glutamyltransferase [Acidobacteriota bacterium]